MNYIQRQMFFFKTAPNQDKKSIDFFRKIREYNQS